MSKLKKCLYLINLMERKGAMTLKEINECYQYSSLYEGDNKQSHKHHVLIPYFLRTWEQRWYLVAEPDNHHHGQAVFALERMDDIKLTDEKKLPSADIDIEDYFDGCFGINHSDDQKPEIIRIKAINTQAEYINALPIHESQKVIETTDGWTIFEYRMVPCYNLYQKLLWYREKIEVLYPDFVRKEMKEILREMVENY